MPRSAKHRGTSRPGDWAPRPPEGPDTPHAVCFLCGERRFTDRIDCGGHRIVRCDNCGLHSTRPLLGAVLHAYYQDDYWRSPHAAVKGYSDYLGEEGRLRRTFRRRLRRLLPALEPGASLLEVGCAAGYLMDEAKAQGFEVHGVEISAPMARRVAARHGAKSVTHGTVDDVPLELGPFAAALAFDVIEHVEDPLRLLRRVRELLEPGGRLLLVTQNIRSAFARLAGRRWHHLKLEHLYHFCPGTLRRLLDRAGFELDWMTAADAGKYVSPAFVVERSTLLHPAVPRLLRRFADWRRHSLWVNPRDELLALARRRD